MPIEVSTLCALRNRRRTGAIAQVQGYQPE